MRDSTCSSARDQRRTAAGRGDVVEPTGRNHGLAGRRELLVAADVIRIRVGVDDVTDGCLVNF